MVTLEGEGGHSGPWEVTEDLGRTVRNLGDGSRPWRRAEVRECHIRG